MILQFEHWQQIIGLLSAGAFMGGIFGKDTSTANQSTTQQQVGAQGATGAQSPTVVGGAASVGTGSSGLNLERSNLAYGTGNIVTISTPDVAALEANTTVSEAALAANVHTAHDALAAVAQMGSESQTVALQSIQAGLAESQANTAFGTAALQIAAASQASQTTVLEQEAAQFASGAAQIANNAQIAAQNLELAGVTPGQTLDTSSILSTGGTTLTKVAAWVGIAGAVVAAFYFLTRKKA